MQFKDIVGQQDVANRLTEIIDSGRVSHAQLLLGDTREGSLQMAFAYLQYLCCTDRRHYGPDAGLRADSCGQCPSCKKIASLQHPDLHVIFPNPPNGSTSVSAADYMKEFQDFVLERQALGTLDEFNLWLDRDVKTSIIRESDAATVVQSLGMKAYEGGWKMVVVWMPEKMNGAAANELLKTLEEPPAQSLILMVCENDERLLSTIRSRVQTVRLRSHPVSAAADEGLREQYGPLLVEWLRMLFKLKMKELSTQVDKLAGLGREQQKQLLNYALGVMHECFMATATGQGCVLGTGDAKFDAMFPAMITPNNIELIQGALDDAIFAIERNANGKIALMELSFRLSKALKKR